MFPKSLTYLTPKKLRGSLRSNPACISAHPRTKPPRFASYTFMEPRSLHIYPVASAYVYGERPASWRRRGLISPVRDGLRQWVRFPLSPLALRAARWLAQQPPYRSRDGFGSCPAIRLSVLV